MLSSLQRLWNSGEMSMLVREVHPPKNQVPTIFVTFRKGERSIAVREEQPFKKQLPTSVTRCANGPRSMDVRAVHKSIKLSGITVMFLRGLRSTVLRDLQLLKN